MRDWLRRTIYRAFRAQVEHELHEARLELLHAESEQELAEGRVQVLKQRITRLRTHLLDAEDQ